MNELKKCEGCGKRDHCDHVYGDLGKSKSPPVAGKIMLAFVMPLLFFIIVLVFGISLLQPFFESEDVACAVAFFIAVAAVLFMIVAIRFIKNKRHIL